MERKVTIYGSDYCPDTVEAKDLFEKNKVEYDYVDISSGTAPLAKFLKIRDTSALFDNIRGKGSIGIPTIELEGRYYLFGGAEEIQKFIDGNKLSA
ncbi:MAG: hypothetical protein LBR61_10450 [Synergistaceae bacterium]|jgi:glutaredoxin-related protein|nr:hypothetical protein [Synergistaceae bacterium]